MNSTNAMNYSTAMILTEAQRQNRNLAQKFTRFLNDNEPIRFQAFNTRFLWEFILGKDNRYGNKNDAAVLFHIVNWTVQREGRDCMLKTWNRENQTWCFWNSSKQIAAKTHLKVRTVDRTMWRLKKSGFIGYKVMRNEFGDTVRHIWLNFENIYKAIANKCRTIFGDELIQLCNREYAVSVNAIYTSKDLKKRDIDPDPEAEKNLIAKPKTKTQTAIANDEPQTVIATDKAETAIADDSFWFDDSEDSPTTESPLTLNNAVKAVSTPRVDEKVNKEVKLKTATETAITGAATKIKITSCPEINPEPNTTPVDEIVNIKGKNKAIVLLAVEAIAQNYINLFSKKLARLKASPEIERPRLKKDMPAKHTPGGDRYFGSDKNQQSEVRGRAKMDSVVGMSKFKSLEDLQECQRQLTLYFAKSLDPIQADEKARWLIKEEKQGMQSPYINDYYQGQAIGEWCKQDWEIEPGVIFPAFKSYLIAKLRKDKDTREQVNEKVYWFLKNISGVTDAWKECKRVIDIERPRIEKAIGLGQNLISLNIPEWYLDCFSKELSTEEVADTAQALKTIAEEYHEQKQVIQNHLEPRKLDSLSHATQSNIQATKPAIAPEAPEADKNLLNTKDILPSMPEPDPRDTIVSPTDDQDNLLLDKIDSYLQDPAKREVGIKTAKMLNRRLLRNDAGEAIAIDRKKPAPPSEPERRIDPDEVMDRVVADNQAFTLESKLKNLMPGLSEQGIKTVLQNIISVNELLANPDTRQKGLSRAEECEFPIDSTLIEVDLAKMRDYIPVDRGTVSSPIPTPVTNPASDELKKTSKDVWAAAKAKLSIFKKDS